MAPILILSTIFIPWIGALVIWLIGDRNRKALNIFAVGFSALSGFATLLLTGQISENSAVVIPLGSAFGDLSFRADGLGVLLVCIATIIGCLAVIFSIDYMKHEDQLARYYAFVLFFIGGMAGLVLTGSLMFMFLFWEITALCSYALIAFHTDDPKAVKGGIKALIITQVGGVGLLVGALIIFSQTGSFDINQFLSNPTIVPAGLLAFAAFGFLIAAAAKSAQFPFQTWLPDAMEAPTPISALIHAATMVNAGVYLLARFYPAFEGVPGWKIAVISVGVITALMASIMGLVANDLKRVLAYSTVSQLGYMVYAVGLGAVYAAQFHLLSHAVFKALLFLAAGAVIHGVGTRDIRLMGGLGRKMPFIRFGFIVGALALSGIPIFNGFWSKELILEAGLAKGPGLAFALMLLGAGITALYTFRCVWLVFYGESRSDLHTHDAAPEMRVAIIPLIGGSLLSWLFAGGLSDAFHHSMPFHNVHVISTMEMVREVVLAPAMLIAMLVILIGFSAWIWRGKLTGLSRSLNFVAVWAENSFGFEYINSAIIKITNSSAELMRNLQTGYLNWNIFAVISGLVFLLALLILGA